MKKELSLLFFAFFCLFSVTTYAVPARPTPFDYVQPNGDTLVIRLRGDERMHFHTTEDGIRIVKNQQNYYCYAIKDKNGNYIAGKKIAHNADKRSKCEQRYIKKINKKYYNK